MGTDDSPIVVLSDSRTHNFATMEGVNAQKWVEMFIQESCREIREEFVKCNSEWIELLAAEGLIINGFEKGSRNSRHPLKPPSPIQIGGKITRKDLEYQELEESIKQVAEAQGKLWTFFWETTYNCNEKCIHCFNPGASHRDGEHSRRSTKTIDRTRILCLLDELRDLGVFRIVFSGGEILVSPDWEFILEQANQRAFEIHVYTNGVLLNKQNLSKLLRFWPQTVSISIYSTDPEIHDSVTRTPFSHEYSIKALKDLREAGIKTTIKSPIMNRTANEIYQLSQLAVELGARISFDTMISAGNDGNLYPTMHNLTWNQLLVLALNELSPSYVGDSSRRYGEVTKDPLAPVCGAGRSIMSMAPDGVISPCCALPIQVGDITQQSMMSIWQSLPKADSTNPTAEPQSKPSGIQSLKDWKSVVLKDYTECGKHDRCSWCHKCPGAALNETADVLSPSEVQCQIASSRMTVANLLKEGVTDSRIVELAETNKIPQPEITFNVYIPRNSQSDL